MSKFILLRCPGCGNEQPVFSRPSTNVKCLVCDYLLAKARGGKGKIRGKFQKSLDDM